MKINEGKSLCSFDFDTAYTQICAEKSICGTGTGRKKYEAAMTALYHAVCLDIDDTITYKNHEERKMIVNALAQLAKRNVIVCFITGRGRSSAFEFLNELKALVMKSDPHIRESQFCRWYCITNNGYILFSNDYMNQNGFLTRCRTLVPPEIKAKYSQFKAEMQQAIAQHLSKKLLIPYDKIIKDSLLSIGENSLRFPIDPQFDEQVGKELIDEIKELVAKITKCCFGINRGVYNKTGKIVIEVSMTTKGAAIDRFEADVGIPKNKMIRIGDQGDYAGNDFEMLNNQCGFSVGKLSKSPEACWPILHYTDPMFEPDVLYGIEATACLLNTLKIYPAICLETPEETTYLPRLAISEKRNINANKATYDFYENQIKYAFRYDTAHFKNVWNYIDDKTGAFYIHDAEYELLRVEQPNHILFKIYDCQLYSRTSYHPRLKFAMKTDTGLLLRGPMNYYYGLAFRNHSGDNISKNFIKHLNQNRVHFFKICVAAIANGNSLNAKDSITRRVLLGVMDSVRDYLLLISNIYLQTKAGSQNILYLFRESNEQKTFASYEDKCLYDLFCIAKENLTYMYNCLFDNIDAQFTTHFLSFLKEKILPISKTIERYIDNLGDDYIFKKGCRVWREIDSFFENVVAVDTSINKLLYECNVVEKEILFYGIRYGSIELPIIVAMLLDVKYKFFNINFNIGYMCLNSDYTNNHSKSLNSKDHLYLINRNEFKGDGYFHVLMDDNLVTGRTLQLAMNLLADQNLYPDRIVVVRYPSLNRFRHMFLPNHGAPDTDLFWEYVYGLTSPTPYTKLIHPACYRKKADNMYLDALGQFNKVKSYVVELLYKNGLYSSEGEVFERGEMT